MLFIFILAFALVRGQEPLVVPQDVMSFIMGCERSSPARSGLRVPFYHTNIDRNGVITEEVSFIDMGQLRTALQENMASEDSIDKIIGQIEEKISGSENLVRSDVTSGSCTEVRVSVPPTEVKEFNEQLQSVVQQNNYQLLEQINTLLSYKMNALNDNIEKMIAQRLSSATPVQNIGEEEPMMGDTGMDNSGVTNAGNSAGNQIDATGETRIFSSAPKYVVDDSPLDESKKESINIQDAAPIESLQDEASHSDDTVRTTHIESGSEIMEAVPEPEPEPMADETETHIEEEIKIIDATPDAQHSLAEDKTQPEAVLEEKKTPVEIPEVNESIQPELEEVPLTSEDSGLVGGRRNSLLQRMMARREEMRKRLGDSGIRRP